MNTTRNRPDTRIAETIAGGIDAGSDARLRRQLAAVRDVQPAAAVLHECRFWDQEYFRVFQLAEHLLQMRGFPVPQLPLRMTSSPRAMTVSRRDVLVTEDVLRVVACALAVVFAVAGCGAHPCVLAPERPGA